MFSVTLFFLLQNYMFFIQVEIVSALYWRNESLQNREFYSARLRRFLEIKGRKSRLKEALISREL